MDRIIVTILKWAKYNPRKDIKHPTWFALSNRLLEDPDLYDFDPLEFKAYVYILCQASQKNSPTVTIVFAHADRVSNVALSWIFSAVDKLVKIGVLRIDEDPRTQSERARTDSERDTTLQDTTDKTNTTARRSSSTTPKKRLVVHFNSVEELRAGIGAEKLAAWLQIYPDQAYIDRELIKAFEYYRDNVRKCPTVISGWKTALGSWLDRGWSRHVAGIPGNPSKTAPQADHYEQLAGRLIDAAKRFPPGDEAIGAFIGPDWEWVATARIMPQVRTLGANDHWGKKRIATDLREAHDRFLGHRKSG